ncbi:hypothetical protein NP493_410g06020 [Ridgeia piscesae]|uniref:Uncharacterized protein n=1 Tax=Ridgeia piscesae TaxID=27915 RepID=A0AAD9L192_RIDPI|nr:hypothetical protein NP493_410g06020 [Ridgeia piscesae]
MDPASQDQFRVIRQLSFARCGFIFGIFLLFTGVSATSMGYSIPSLRVVRLIGPLVLVAGLTLLVVGIVAFVHLKNKLPQTSVANVPVVSGMAPGWGSYPPVGVANQPVPGTYPLQQQPGQMGYWQQPGQMGYQQQPGQMGYQQQPGQMGYQQQPGQDTQPFVPQPTAPPVGYLSDTAE